MARACAHVMIQGRVQGVGFRYSCCDEAIERNLAGWVRNTYDGAVEALFEGEKDDVDDMIAWCRRGPVSADVSSVEVDWQQPSGKLKSFSISH